MAITTCDGGGTLAMASGGLQETRWCKASQSKREVGESELLRILLLPPFACSCSKVALVQSIFPPQLVRRMGTVEREWVVLVGIPVARRDSIAHE